MEYDQIITVVDEGKMRRKEKKRKLGTDLVFDLEAVETRELGI
jgi:hypothetical protein